MTELAVTVRNHGYLGTFGLPSARALPVSEPLRLKIECEGPTLLAPTIGVLELGHLEGWGQGLFGGQTLFAPWTRGSVSEARATLAFTGKGRVRLTLASCRVGSQAKTVELA